VVMPAAPHKRGWSGRGARDGSFICGIWVNSQAKRSQVLCSVQESTDAPDALHLTSGLLAGLLAFCFGTRRNLFEATEAQFLQAHSTEPLIKYT
jgi:hypothetical protein